jgi:hypothetical protein
MWFRRPLKGAKLGGAYLPDPDDPRWKETKEGDYHYTRFVLGGFRCFVWGAIELRGERIGLWKRYVRAVRRGIAERTLERRERDSLEELENAS